MVQCTPQTREMQEQRLKIKQLGQQMQNLATEGAGLSPWEARELVLKATENYLEKFKRVAYLRKEKGFTEFEISRTVGISTAATKTFIAIYNAFKGKALFDLRMEEINIAGKSYNLAEGEKKDLPASKISTPAKRGVR